MDSGDEDSVLEGSVGSGSGSGSGDGDADSDAVPRACAACPQDILDCMERAGCGEPPLAAFFTYWRTLLNQEARFREQLSELQQRNERQQQEANALRFRMEELSRDAMVKGAGMDRLQAELEAANKDSESVRQKLRQLESELTTYRQQNADLLEQLNQKTTEDCESTKKLEEKVKELEVQLKDMQQERDRLEKLRIQLEAEREEEMKIVQEALDEAQQEKAEMQAQFEKLHTETTNREQQMLDDFEWKLREVEQACKKRLVEKEQAFEEKIKETTKKLEQQHKGEIATLKAYEAEVHQLRGLSHEQQRSMRNAARQTEELQVAEKMLKEEVARLKTVIETEKSYAATIQNIHDKHVAEAERKLQSQLQIQRNEINAQWEERTHREFSRLKSEMEKVHNEEKKVAIQSIRKQLEDELQKTKGDLEKKLQKSLREVEQLRSNLAEKEQYYQKEIEKTRTNADRDIFDLRRKLDKIDMAYQEQMEKLTEKHEKEIESQWEKLNNEKEDAIKSLEEKHQNEMKQFRDEVEEMKKMYMTREKELNAAIENLQLLLDKKNKDIDELQRNVDLFDGGLQVLNKEISTQGKEILRVKTKAQNCIRERDARLSELKEKYEKEKEQWNKLKEEMQQEINVLSQRLHTSTDLRKQPIHEEHEEVIADLKKVLAERDNELRLLTEEKRYYQLHFMKMLKDQKVICSPQSVTGILDPQQEQCCRKGGGSPEFNSGVTTNVLHSSSLPLVSEHYSRFTNRSASTDALTDVITPMKGS
ncbi:golgin subfamily A member 6-like protein 22 isoform X2 [Schistocerca cancellata]|uniref:golgin subfamily A member 6-like protein 22 isoform X2 n=1 Tax=Schistocerca cancellata TaxID=274614 RepID=UPI00211865F6|nr:golgin subfamily A member 6-like protein 22 isoform X2 [Schistocerca cancellata]